MFIKNRVIKVFAILLIVTFFMLVLQIILGAFKIRTIFACIFGILLLIVLFYCFFDTDLFFLINGKIKQGGYKYFFKKITLKRFVRELKNFLENLDCDVEYSTSIQETLLKYIETLSVKNNKGYKLIILEKEKGKKETLLFEYFINQRLIRYIKNYKKDRNKIYKYRYKIKFKKIKK